MIRKIISNYSANDLIKYGHLNFHLGILFLPSLFPLSIIFLLFALIISLINYKIDFKRDKWNLTLLIIYILMIISSINALYINPVIENSNKIDISINALRWLILFLSFTGFQIYLKTQIQRIVFAKLFALSCIPLLISCALQYWFKIYGPFTFLNGLIIWYNKPLIGIDQGVAGLFSNQNYTGLWLSILWPFSVYFFLKSKKHTIKKISSTIFLLATVFFIFLTTSRSAILGVLISVPIIFSLKILIKILIILFLIYLLISLLPIDFYSDNNLFQYKTIKIISSKFKVIDINNLSNITRIKIWENTFNLISRRPILGYGAGLFPFIYVYMKEEYMAQHSHNIILQIAFEYGYPIALLLTIFAFSLMFKSWLKIFYKKNKNSFQIHLIDKCWYASCLIALIGQLSDVTYFEGKISIIIWILLAGIKCIIEESSKDLVNF